jgi:hypothetical protein
VSRPSTGIGILVIVVDESYNFRPKEGDILVGMNHPFVVDFNRHTTDIVCSIAKNNHANVLSLFQGDGFGLVEFSNDKIGLVRTLLR